MSAASSPPSVFMPHASMENMSEMQQGLIMAVRALSADAEEDQVTGEELRAQLADLYPPTVLLGPDMMRQPLIHQQLLAWLHTREVYLGGTDDMRSVKRLAATLYPAGGDKVAAQQILANIDNCNESLCRYATVPGVYGRNAGLERILSTPPSGARSGPIADASAASDDRDDIPPPNLGAQDARSGLPPLAAFGRSASQGVAGRRPNVDAGPVHSGFGEDTAEATDNILALRISLRFKNNSSKFSGDPNECLDDFVADYELVCRDYGLSPMQMLRYIYNLLRDDAKRFYLNELVHSVNSYDLMVMRLRNEYHSDVRQSQARNKLASLRMVAFESKGMSVEQALTATYQAVLTGSKLLPPSHSGEVFRVEYLRDAVVGYEWATEPLSRVSTHKLGFQKLYGELQAALFQHQEAKRARLQDAASGRTTQTDGGNEVSAFYQGQGRYERKHVGVGNRAVEKPTGRFNPLSIMGCFNCDNPKHTINDCPLPRDVARAALKRLEYLSKRKAGRGATAQVLFELCSQINETAAAIKEEANPDKDAPKPAEDLESDTLFAALVNVSALVNADEGADDVQDFAARD